MPHLSQSIFGLAGAVRRLGRTPGEALQRHVEGLLLDARGFGSEAQLLQRLNADADLVRGLADRIRRRDRAIDQRTDSTDRRGADERAAQRPDPSAQQLRLTAQVPEPARGALARALDALQALLAALADRDQLGLDLTAALDRQADRVGLGASGHGSACVLRSGVREEQILSAVLRSGSGVRCGPHCGPAAGRPWTQGRTWINSRFAVPLQSAIRALGA
jgi:hypothetical protein